MKLLREALIKFTCGLALVGLLIFLPAGTFRYTYGWFFIGLLFVPMLIAGFVVAGLDFCFGWSNVPAWVVVTASVLFLMMPLVLGSWYALIAFTFYPAIIIVRLKDEEELLTKELPGYDAYKQKVKRRIIPFIW